MPVDAVLWTSTGISSLLPTAAVSMVVVFVLLSAVSDAPDGISNKSDGCALGLKDRMDFEFCVSFLHVTVVPLQASIEAGAVVKIEGKRLGRTDIVVDGLGFVEFEIVGDSTSCPGENAGADRMVELLTGVVWNVGLCAGTEQGTGVGTKVGKRGCREGGKAVGREDRGKMGLSVGGVIVGINGIGVVVIVIVSGADDNRSIGMEV
jgi:hypothetical protein